MAAADNLQPRKGAVKRQYDGSNGGINERDDDELSIPRAALNKMIKELTPNIRVANDARELILACCTEFIHYISSAANDLCGQQQKKTISPEHVLAGLLIKFWMILIGYVHCIIIFK
jgi:histone H3/H4